MRRLLLSLAFILLCSGREIILSQSFTDQEIKGLLTTSFTTSKADPTEAITGIELTVSLKHSNFGFVAIWLEHETSGNFIIAKNQDLADTCDVDSAIVFTDSATAKYAKPADLSTCQSSNKVSGNFKPVSPFSTTGFMFSGLNTDWNVYLNDSTSVLPNFGKVYSIQLRITTNFTAAPVLTTPPSGLAITYDGTKVKIAWAALTPTPALSGGESL